MGWGRTLFLGDIGNRLDIGDCENEIARLRRRLKAQSTIDRSQDQQMQALSAENDELKLYLAALIRLLTSKNVISTSEITRLVEAIDAEDGSIDGRAAGPIA